MSFSAWPLGVGSKARRGTWRLAPRPELEVTPFDQGPDRARRLFTKLRFSAAFIVVMNAAEFQLFKGFYFGEINHGADKFTMPFWDGEVYSTVTVNLDRANPWTAEDWGIDLNRITLNLTILDLPVLDGAALWLIEQYGPDFVINQFGNPFHIVINGVATLPQHDIPAAIRNYL